MNNYQFLEPVFTEARETVKASGWLTEFNKMDTTEKADKVLSQGIDLLGPRFRQDAEGNSLVAGFNKVAEIMDVILLAQKRDISDQELADCIESFCKLLRDLDNNMFFRKYTYEHMKDSNGFKEFMDRVSAVQAEGLQFNPNSLKRYVAFANKNVPKMIVFLDQS